LAQAKLGLQRHWKVRHDSATYMNGTFNFAFGIDCESLAN